MKIRSLHHAEPSALRATVIVDDLAKPYDLSAFEGGSVFVERIDDIPPGECRALVAVNLNVHDLHTLAANTERFGTLQLQYWVDAEGVLQLVKALETLHALAIDGLAASNGWLRLHLTAASSTDRSAQDFATGLNTGQFLSPVLESPPQTQAEPVRDSAMSKVISIVAKTAKPLKPYLPAPVIHTAYRVIGLLR